MPLSTVRPYAYRANDAGRSAAGLTADQKLVLITARQTVKQLTSYLIEHFGVQTALSFDGGRSASMAWLDATNHVQQFAPSNQSRAVAVGMMVFTQ
ncbi:MAG: phosphodiester glycosidase family protein [Anaerolineae bacterium]|nr:phosphodiester glycosidase family protein [Anaerolineae bacterium]